MSTHPQNLRVLIITESFLPQVNGVTNSVCRITEYLTGQGHTVHILAPTGPDTFAGAQVSRVRGIGFPRSVDFTAGMASRRRIERFVAEIDPDVIHLASPFGYAAHALTGANRRPTVAVYQTDVPGFLGRFGLGVLETWSRNRLHAVHRRADLTLVPSVGSLSELTAAGVADVRLWTRGVDLELFRPDRRSEKLHQTLRGDSRVIAGYVGRLSPEKQLEQLQVLRDVPGLRLVLVGDGPDRRRLERLLPWATFLGARRGEDLAALFATFDVFVHPGEHETFCQSAQEALASGTPIVGPQAGGMGERIREGVNGFGYAAGDLSTLRSAVAALAEDSDRRAQLSERARDGSSLQTWDAVSEQLVTAYRSIIRIRTAPGGSPVPEHLAELEHTGAIEAPAGD